MPLPAGREARDGRDKRRRQCDERRRCWQMGGGGVRSEETGQLAGRTRGMKGDGRNERRRQMGGGGVRRGNTTTSRRTRGLEGQDEWPESSVNTADGSFYGIGWRDGNSTARNGAMVTCQRWAPRNGASAMVMLSRPAVGEIKANAS